MKLSIIGAVLIGFLLSCRATNSCVIKYSKIKSGIQETPAVDFSVNVEFLIYTTDQRKSPVVINAFIDAVTEWSKHIPIRATFYFENEPSIWALGQKITADRVGIIRIVVADLQKPPYNTDPNVIGLWSSSRNRLLFDVDFFENNPTKAYAVALHELGHMFGLPHFIGSDEFGYTSYIVVPSTEDAQNYVMYPSSIKDKSQDILSPIEIEIAKHQVWYLLTPPYQRMVNDCKIILDKH